MNFYQAVYKLTRKIPRGKVSTYQQIATLAGTPRAARVVGFALRALPHETDVPWQRVINSKGMISIENLNFPKEEQARLLAQEGVAVEEREGTYFVDLQKYLWKHS